MPDSPSPLFLPRKQILPLSTQSSTSSVYSNNDSPPFVSASPSPLPSPPNGGHFSNTLSILEEVIDLADRTNKLKLKVIDAFRDINCDNCRASSHGICRTHMTGNGVFNMRATPIPRLSNPSPEEHMSKIFRVNIESQKQES
jgi:hypothetical protein